MKSNLEKGYFENRAAFLKKLVDGKRVPIADVADNFSKYASRQQVSRFLARAELFKLMLPMKGSIVECGVFAGDGLMTWAQLSSIYEPFNYHRKIIGFDTFQGFPSVNKKDVGVLKHNMGVVGGLCSNSYEELQQCIALYDQNRVIPHMTKVKLVKGDFLKTGKAFIKENQHMIISMLYLDFDTYDATRHALQTFLPRMSKGAIIAFDEINNEAWPGETAALLEEVDVKRYELRQFSHEPNIAYMVL